MTISVVIPALDEAENIAGAIESVLADGSHGSHGSDGPPGLPDDADDDGIRLHEAAAGHGSAGAGPAGGASRSGPVDPIDGVDGPARADRPERPGHRRASPDIEICVVDGGSRDGTVERARRAGRGACLRIVGLGEDGTEVGPATAPGAGRRARQLELGLRSARGDVVLFLHADTRLPRGWSRAVEAAMARPEVSGGAFRFGFRETGRADGALPGRWSRISLRIVEAGARLRSAWLRLPYGDQALFARRSLLLEMGGIPQAPWMEDLDLVRALRRHGRLVILPLTARTSARRHLDGGVWRVALRHATALAVWVVGADRGRWARRLRG